MQSNVIILIITCILVLVLVSSLIQALWQDSKTLFYFFYKPFISTKHYKKSDYNKAFKYLIKRKTITKASQGEERQFFLSLINEAIAVKQLKEFTEQIKRFYQKKIKSISAKKFKNQQQNYIQQYKEIVIFLVMAIKNRYENISEFDRFKDYQAFANLITTADEVTAIDAILIFAEKLKPADYKKIVHLANQKKAVLAPHMVASSNTYSRLPLGKLITNSFRSVIRYGIFCYLILLFSSLALSLAIPKIVSEQEDKLLLIANTLKKQPFIPYFAKLNTVYYIENHKVTFYKQADFLQVQKKYYVDDVTKKLCNTATFRKVCYRNK